MIKIYFTGITEYGSCIYDAVVFVPKLHNDSACISN